MSVVFSKLSRRSEIWMFTYPGHPRNRQRNPGTIRGRVLLNKMEILVIQRNPQDSVPSVRNMAEPKRPTILGIVGNMRKTVLSRKVSRKSTLKPRNPAISLIRQLRILSRKWNLKWRNSRRNQINANAMIWVKTQTTPEALGLVVWGN